MIDKLLKLYLVYLFICMSLNYDQIILFDIIKLTPKGIIKCQIYMFFLFSQIVIGEIYIFKT